jgi:hypothetical protein
MSKIIKLKILFILSKTWSDLVVKTLMHLHEVLGSNLDDTTTNGVHVCKLFHWIMSEFIRLMYRDYWTTPTFCNSVNVCVNVCYVYIHWCILYKYDVQNMYDGSEYLQNILFLKIKLYIYIYIYISQHVFLSWHAMKNLQSMTQKKKTLKKF